MRQHPERSSAIFSRSMPPEDDGLAYSAETVNEMTFEPAGDR
jgi:hypothetical protein